MVLRPVYQMQEGEQNMQYPPYQQSNAPEQGTWQTPWGAETQSTNYSSHGQQQSHGQSAPVGPYAAASPYSGENTAYYQQQPSSESNWSRNSENDHSQRPYNDIPSQPSPYQAPVGPYGYEHSNANPFGEQAPYQTPSYQDAPAVKQEERFDTYGQPNPYQNASAYDLSGVKQEPLAPGADPAFQTEQDRGIMGALAGAAAGGYAGHKMHHGFLGTLGGAYAGHKLENAYKDHQKYNQPPASAPVPPMQPQPPQQHSAPAPARRGNFSASSKDMSLDKDFDLIAQCKNVKGHKKLSAISLNNILTNNDGHFQWVASGGNFGASARNVKLVDGGRVLEAELCCCNGQWRRDSIKLDDRIENSDGDLRML